MQQQSLEAALDDEARVVRAMLEGQTKSRPAPPRSDRGRSPPAQKIRSMLDIDTPLVAPSHSEIAAHGLAGPHSLHHTRSLLDPLGSPIKGEGSSSHRSLSAESSITNIHAHQPGSPSMVAEGWVGRTGNIEEDYKFDVLPSAPSSFKKRVSQGGKKKKEDASLTPAQIDAVMYDITNHGGLGQVSRNERRRPSKSPSGFSRSRSPTPNNFLNNNPITHIPTLDVIVSDSGKEININSAYKKLSDGALLRAGHSELVSSKRKASSVGSPSPDSDAQLLEDDLDDGDGTTAESDDVDENSSGDDTTASEVSRGRRRTRSDFSSSSIGPEDWKQIDGLKNANHKGGKTQTVRSLLAAAEEESKSLEEQTRKERWSGIKVSSKYKVRSLLDPLPIPGSNKNSGVHPLTNFDHSLSPGATPGNSDNEADLPDIRRAQKMNIYQSNDHIEDNRTIRTIIRGDWKKMEEEVEQGVRRSRNYFVATDTSEEAEYALEWALGTIVRDGDDIIAMYAIDQVSGAGKLDDRDDDQVEGAQVINETKDVIGNLTNSTDTSGPGVPMKRGRGSLLATTQRSYSSPGSTDSRAFSRQHRERLRAVDGIADRCIKYLRKTSLQVRISVEVIHCRSPKHLILEAIDALNPTLVIIGSRGQGTVKGVLLGSFSNYLVTKSSVPVMVARKKLKKHAKPNIRLSNNLTRPRRLSYANAA